MNSKPAKCLLCGCWFDQTHLAQHTCPSCDEAVDELDEADWLRKRDEQVQRELDDPSLRERIIQAMKQRSKQNE